MNTGKTLFAQLMDFLPWTTFTRDRRPVWRRSPGPDAFLRRAIPVHGLRPADLPGKPARHRDLPLGPRIETLSHGLPPAGPALDAGRCQRKARTGVSRRWPSGVITQARTLYVDEELGLDLTNTVYALDSTTIALCLSVFPWAHFRTTKAAVKMHTLLDLRGGNIPSFIHISDGKLHDVHAFRYALAGSRSHLRRGSRLRRLCPPLCVCTKPGPSSSRVPSRTSMPIASIRRRRIARPASFASQTISLDAASTPVRITPNFLRRIRFKDPESGKDAGLHHQQLLASGRHHLRALQKPLAGGTLLQVDQAASSDQAVLRHVGERGEDADLDCRLGLRQLVAIVKKRLDLDASLYTLLQILSVTLFEKMPIHQALAGDENRCNASQITNQLNLFDF